MSNVHFPTLVGLTWDIKKAPQFSTLTQKAVSGREVRAALQAYPLYLWTLTYEYLPEGRDFATLLGFFLARQGSYDSFLYVDPSDHLVAGQPLGTGDGATLVFPLVRSLGSFAQPVEDGAASAVYKAGVAQSGSTWSITSSATGYHDQLTFTVAPAIGAAISADFTYSWRVRFAEDTTEFTNFMNQLWSNGGIKLQGVKL
jgi:uncharacterized protein (TIGR02217 family)